MRLEAPPTQKPYMLSACTGFTGGYDYCQILKTEVRQHAGGINMKRMLRRVLKKTIEFARRFQPTRVVAVGFILLILLGTCLLTLPIASKRAPLGFLDALFTATSATCVTGLSVADTYMQFSLFGQVVILTLIQIGGLGFMTLATYIAVLFRRTIHLRGRILAQESVNGYGLEGIIRLTRHVILGTFLFEGAGALVLSIKFIPKLGFAEGIYYGVFHSVSAFCNAGFDLMGKWQASGSLIPYAGDYTVNLVIIALILIGGMGFVVWEDLYSQPKPSRWRVHTKIVLFMTLLLTVVGSIFFAVAEWNGAYSEMPTAQKLLSAVFQSVTTRTAGFSTVSQVELSDSSKLMSILLMFIGASPGSTGGGIKTVTFAVLCLTVFAGLKGEDYINVFRRRLTSGTILRATAVCLIGIGVVVAGSLILSLTNHGEMLPILYEVTSAFATVGLSAGISLQPIGKVVMIAMMYIGRVGVVTIIMSLMMKRATTERNYSYPEERVML